MLSLLLITAMAVQYPQTTPKPADTTSSSRRPAATAAVSRQAFHDTMRELWADHVVYTRQFIVSAAAGTADTAATVQRLLRNQDEIGEAIKPYYGDAAASQLTALLRSHIQHAGMAVAAAKGSQTVMQPSISHDMSVSTRTDTTQIKASSSVRVGTDTAKSKMSRDSSSMYQQPTQQPAYGAVAQTTTDTVALTAAIAALRANGDSIATLLSSANPRNWSRSTLQGALQMHINLLLQEATAHLKRDWQGSIAAFDASLDQSLQMADVLSEGIMKQFPSRFNNSTRSVSSLQ